MDKFWRNTVSKDWAVTSVSYFILSLPGREVCSLQIPDGKQASVIGMWPRVTLLVRVMTGQVSVLFVCS